MRRIHSKDFHRLWKQGRASLNAEGNWIGKEPVIIDDAVPEDPEFTSVGEGEDE